MHPAYLDNLGWAMAEVYGAVTDRLLINLAKYFPYVSKSKEAKNLFEYQSRMLAQMGQVTRESMDIITGSLDGADAALRQTLEAAIMDALKNEVPKLRKAAKAGLIGGGGLLPPELSANQTKTFAAYYRQSADKLNLVNTVMLESTQDAYRATVADVSARITRTQGILNAAAGETSAGVSAWNVAMHDAVKKMVGNGLTGFVDHAGRHWSPEAYTAMDIRTTVFNTARAAVAEEAERFGADLYQVSTHNGARPLCYPWQGKIISRSNQRGETVDLYGNKYQVYPQSETTYGQAAGLFGINCKHFPITWIPTLSTSRGNPQEPEENERSYELSQKQRELERNLRAEKRDLEILKAQGADAETIKAQKGRVDAAQDKLGAFCDENGLPRRRNREYTPIKATFPPPDSYDPTEFSTETQTRVNDFFAGGTTVATSAADNGAAALDNEKPAFVPAASIQEAIIRAEAGGVRYARFESMTLERANNALEALETLPIDVRPVAIANGKETEILTGRSLGRKADMWYGVTYDYRAFNFDAHKLGYTPDYNGGICVGLNTQKYKTLESLTAAKNTVNQRYRAKTGHDWFFNTDGRLVACHEMGHVYADMRGLPDNWEALAARWANESQCDMLKTPTEAFAEAWAAYRMGGPELPDYIRKVMEELK